MSLYLWPMNKRVISRTFWYFFIFSNHVTLRVTQTLIQIHKSVWAGPVTPVWARKKSASSSILLESSVWSVWSVFLRTVGDAVALASTNIRKRICCRCQKCLDVLDVCLSLKSLPVDVRINIHRPYTSSPERGRRRSKDPVSEISRAVIVTPTHTLAQHTHTHTH